jgi:phenylpropionate dioxygenase-like ring-hydroxylating dioxygenase large terminal subunit
MRSRAARARGRVRDCADRCRLEDALVPIVNADDYSLPAWIYGDPEFFALERERVFRPSWQGVCHISDIPSAGDFHTFEFLGESLFVVRGADGAVRGFHNVCRHRAGRLLDGPRGSCRRIVCPYHAWAYELDGRLAGVPDRASYPALDAAHERLAAVDTEVCAGFVFVRLAGGGPSVAEMVAPYADEIARQRFERLQPIGRVTLRPRPVNWKNIGDNYSDGLHIAVAHPGLTRLLGGSYRVEARAWVDRMGGELQAEPSAVGSERAYQKYLPPVPELPPERQRAWTYYKLWPNLAFDVYPDQVDFMQWLPISPTETLIREIAYALPDERREMRAARYLNWRINRRVNAEDTRLLEGVQAGMASSSYRVGPLSTREVALRSFGARMRALIPECRELEAPAPGWSATVARPFGPGLDVRACDERTLRPGLDVPGHRGRTGPA